MLFKVLFLSFTLTASYFSFRNLSILTPHNIDYEKYQKIKSICTYDIEYHIESTFYKGRKEHLNLS